MCLPKIPKSPIWKSSREKDKQTTIWWFLFLKGFHLEKFAFLCYDNNQYLRGGQMLIVITSDSHGRSDTLQEIAARHPQADLFLDAGDSECQESEIHPFLSVRGNRDYFLENRYRIEEINGYRIFLFHGDRSILTKEFLIMLARNNNCQILIHGHTHVPYYLCHQGIHLLNPGSVTYPRSLKGATYALLEINGDEVKVEFRKAHS